MSSDVAPPVTAPHSCECSNAAPMSGDVDVPNSMMRKTIAKKRLHAAKNDAPHFYLNRSVNMTKLLAWRKRLNDEVAIIEVIILRLK